MTVICTKPTTPESRKRHAETFGEKPDRYCETCGRLPSFCECLNAFIDMANKAAATGQTANLLVPDVPLGELEAWLPKDNP